MSYAFVVSNDRPDFIGELVGDVSGDGLVLKNPVAVNYSSMRGEPTTEFMPIGMDPDYTHEFTVAITSRNIMYIVVGDENQIFAQKYLDFIKRHQQHRQIEADQMVLSQ